jgi:competence CoiA-like predicted nuclease
MERRKKRTINEVLDYETGECIDAETFFRKPLDEITVYRSKLQQAIEKFTEPLFGCFYCKQKVRIRGGISQPHKRKAEIFHFAHLKDSDECHIKTKNNFTREEVNRIKYNGAKESTLHQTLKENIAECLRRNEMTKKEVLSVEVEKIIRNKVVKEWKKPDINAFFNGKHIAIELQLSTTWLDVITRRQHFYKEQGIYIFWVFHTFNENDDLRKLTYNDVIYTNNQNAYIFDKETYDLSKSENDLFLKCYYKTYHRVDQKLSETWQKAIVNLSDLTFDEQNFRIYYHDTETQKKNAEQEIRDYISELRESGKLRILHEQEQEKIKHQQQSEFEELEREEKRKQEELEKKILDLKENIKGIIVAKAEIEQKENKSKIKLAELIEFVSKSADYAEKTIKYFADKKNSSKPFYDYDDLFKTLKDEFAEQIENTSQTIENNSQDVANLSKSLSVISKMKSIEISGKSYSSINNFVDWNFIKNNYSQIKIINKNQIDSLFAAEYMKSVKSDYEINHYQHSNDIYFLIDLSVKVSELDQKKKICQEIIAQQETILTIMKQKIKTKFEIHFNTKIKEVNTKLIQYLERQTKLSIYNDKMKTAINKLEKTL